MTIRINKEINTIKDKVNQHREVIKKLVNKTTLTIAIAIVSVVGITISFNYSSIQVKAQTQQIDYSQGLSGQAYLDYTAKMAKELNDIDYGYEAINKNDTIYSTISIGGVKYIRYLFPNINFEKLEKSKFPNNYNPKSKCETKDNKYLVYYFYFSGMCHSREDGSPIEGNSLTIFYQSYSTQIAKNDNWGYDNYNTYGGMTGICQPRAELHNSNIDFIKKYEPELYKQSKIDFPTDTTYTPITQAEYEQQECVKDFYKFYPKFIPDKNKCDTSDWLIFELGIRVNPHCSMVNINDVPLKLHYYYTSWGLYKIGTKPDITKDQRVNFTTREEALADNDPEKPKAVLEKQKVEREKSRLEQEKKALEREKYRGSNNGTDEADRIFFEKERLEKERLNSIRAPSSGIINNIKYQVRNLLTYTGLLIVFYQAQYLISDIINYYYRITIPLTIFLFLCYYALELYSSKRRR